MSGLAGLWNLDGHPADEALLARMSATLAHRGPDGEGRWMHGAAGLACQLSRVTPESVHETQPLANADGVALVFDGRLDNREELLQRLQDTTSLANDASDPALILAAYHAAGDALPEWLNGDFALALFDARRQQLLLARDALGVRPLYYTRAGYAVVFASEIKALLAHPNVAARPNEEALADMLLGRARDADTLFAGIASVPPAHAVLVTRRQWTTRRYWDFDLRRQIRLRSFQDYAEAFRDVFEQAVARRLRSRHPVAVSASGGLDSSSIFCAGHALIAHGQTAATQLCGVSYTTTAGSPSDEQAFLRAIEARYGTTIHRVPFAPGGFLSRARESVWHVETPLLDEQWDNLRHFFDEIRQLDARVLLTGHWGDQVLFPQAYLVDLIRRGAWGTVRTHLREFPRWMTDVEPRYFLRTLQKNLLKYALPAPLFMAARWLRDRVVRRHPWYTAALRGHQRARPLGCAARTAHARELYEQARTPYHVLSLEWDNKIAAAHGLDMAFPMLDRDVLAFLMAVPGEYVNDGGVPRALLRAALRDVLPESIAQRRWKADFTDEVNASVRRELPALLRLIEDGGCVRARGYLTRSTLTRAMARWTRGLSGETAEAAWALSDVAGLELWLQVFCNGAPHVHSMTGGLHEPAEVSA